MWYENEADVYIEAMKQHFGVKTMAQLGAHLGVGQPSISAWKSRNAIELIQNRCLELGIFEEIFENPKIKDELQKIKALHCVASQHKESSHEEPTITFGSQQVAGYLNALNNIATAEGCEDELICDLKCLIQKYMKK